MTKKHKNQAQFKILIGEKSKITTDYLPQGQSQQQITNALKLEQDISSKIIPKTPIFSDYYNNSQEFKNSPSIKNHYQQGQMDIFNSNQNLITQTKKYITNNSQKKNHEGDQNDSIMFDSLLQ
ncbi:hypothetical protein PPERSA_08660 [Pseudocohnilembus persalinus]|uniref:Uncharacterized protein n=1 Tax=Pseudocohnilembus persalinus TaxID=266149 RepID=A0A0V0R838_PSEPJ|nr:hypothetical protein PPERSA_08660 [Pseudocohnilembus persalinus]|eukprot:KRX10665.1 hypothetical protein PPERSA_08660 [Pseudocohnilembus persalinus]